MKPSKFYMYISVTLFGLLGAIAGGFIGAAHYAGGLECLGAAISGVGLGGDSGEIGGHVYCFAQSES